METHQHPYKLRAYHNPEGVDESKVPDGWRFLYADEAGKSQNKPCRAWMGPRPFFEDGYDGNSHIITYIVPVSA